MRALSLESIRLPSECEVAAKHIPRKHLVNANFLIRFLQEMVVYINTLIISTYTIYIWMRKILFHFVYSYAFDFECVDIKVYTYIYVRIVIVGVCSKTCGRGWSIEKGWDRPYSPLVFRFEPCHPFLPGLPKWMNLAFCIETVLKICE